MHEYCTYRRQAEKDGMMRAVEILNKNQIDKKAREAQKEKERDERRKQKDQELDSKYSALNSDGGAKKPWWKVW